MKARWEGDERGRGVADATAFSDSVGELAAAMREPGWVAEDPDVHLLPHLKRACEQLPFELADTRVDDGVHVVRLAWKGERSIGQVRAAIFALLGSIAESATYVRQRNEDDELEYEVVTGMLADPHFAPHGHTLILRITL